MKSLSKLTGYWSKAGEMFKLIARNDCVLCGRDIKYLYKEQGSGNIRPGDFCEDCSRQFEKNLCCCELCAIPLEHSLENLSGEQIICGACQKHSPNWTRALASFKYSYPIDRVLIALKYKTRIDFCASLARYMARDIQLIYGFTESSQLPPDCIVPVPLHFLREIKRGYNQAELLAKTISQELGIPIRRNLVKRIRHTPSQSQLSKAQREKNLQHAFKVLPGVAIPEYVCLIDDVMTTGSTTKIITRVLLKAGVQRVDVWCCARADI